MAVNGDNEQITVADPGFPIGGRGPCRGACTPEVVTF